MVDKEIVVGDVVTLKSGGPKMTVMSTESAGQYVKAKCAWFDEKTGQHCVGDFMVHSLHNETPVIVKPAVQPAKPPVVANKADDE